MKPTLITLLTALAISTSCLNQEVKGLLSEAESQVQSHPDSALAIIESIDTSKLKTRACKAEYSLLFSQALDKNGIDTSDIRIIRPAFEYFSKHGAAEKRMKAHYYAGRISENGGDYSAAILLYNKALDFTGPDDYSGRGLIYSGMAYVYNSSFNAIEDLQNMKKSYESFVKAGDEGNEKLALFGLANSYHNNQDFRKADSLFKMILNKEDSNSSLTSMTRIALADNSLKSEEYVVPYVRALFESACGNGGSMSVENYYEYAYTLVMDGDEASAESILNSLSSYPPTYFSYWWLYKIEKYKKNYQLSEEYLEKSLKLQNEIVRKKLTQSVFKAQSEHYRLSLKTVDQQKVIDRQRSAILLFILSFSAIALVSFMAIKRRQLQEERGKLIAAIEETGKLLRISSKEAEEKIEAHKDENMELQKMFIDQYQKQFSEIGKHYDSSFILDRERASEKISGKLSAEINSILDEISGESEKQKMFEERINRDMSNVIRKIRDDYPKFKESDIRFLCFEVAGFDTTAISFLTGMSLENVRVKRHRLKQKLTSDTGNNSLLYRAVFSKKRYNT